MRWLQWGTLSPGGQSCHSCSSSPHWLCCTEQQRGLSHHTCKQITHTQTLLQTSGYATSVFEHVYDAVHDSGERFQLNVGNVHGLVWFFFSSHTEWTARGPWGAIAELNEVH